MGSKCATGSTNHGIKLVMGILLMGNSLQFLVKPRTVHAGKQSAS